MLASSPDKMSSMTSDSDKSHCAGSYEQSSDPSSSLRSVLGTVPVQAEHKTVEACSRVRDQYSSRPVGRIVSLAGARR